MRIGINTLFMIPGIVGGSETILRNLISNLATIDSHNEYILFTNRENSGGFNLGQPNFFEVRCPIPARFRPARTLWEQLILPIQCQWHGIEILHSPGYISPIALPCPSVVSILDMNYFFFPEDWSKLALWALKILVPLSARRSCQIIALSQSSKRHIMEALKISEDKINVTYMGVDKIFHPHHNRREILKIKKRIGIKGDFILSVANSHPHKNLRRLLQAYHILRKDKGITHQLLLAGNPGRGHLELVKMVRKLGMGHEVIFTGYLPHHQMPLVYQAADLFVFPSLYEGFGLPILESMACGTPVVSSNAASLPEVVGRAGILVDPHDANEMAGAMCRVLSDKSLTEDLIKNGLEQSKRFSWMQTAKETLTIYKKAMAGRKNSEKKIP